VFDGLNPEHITGVAVCVGIGTVCRIVSSRSFGGCIDFLGRALALTRLAAIQRLPAEPAMCQSSLC
jgi:hypothetical protein